jgi:hypothetical protein
VSGHGGVRPAVGLAALGTLSAPVYVARGLAIPTGGRERLRIKPSVFTPQSSRRAPTGMRARTYHEESL